MGNAPVTGFFMQMMRRDGRVWSGDVRYAGARSGERTFAYEAGGVGYRIVVALPHVRYGPAIRPGAAEIDERIAAARAAVR